MTWEACGGKSMFAPSNTFSFRCAQSFKFQIYTCRRVSSSSFEKSLSIPFSVDISEVQESFQKHHSKHFLLAKPVSSPPIPIPVYLPYYVFSATTSLTYSARLGNTTYERRYNFLSGRWQYYPRTRFYDIPKQRLSDKEYPSTLLPLHIYAGYNQPASWLKLNTTDILSLAGYNPFKSISGVEPQIEEITRPIEALKAQAVHFLHISEEERAKKYLQRTYDPDDIKFTTNILNYNLQYQQLYIPVWIFEFTDGDQEKKYKTYVAGWGGGESTSGLIFYHPGLSGAIAGVLTAVVSTIWFWPSVFTIPVIGGVVGVLVTHFIREMPNFQRIHAHQETENKREEDRKAASQQQYKRQQQSAEDQQQQQQRERERERPKSKYPPNDPQGLYQTLEISPTATESEIGAAFRRLARIHHPDMVSGGLEEKNAAKARFQNLSTAYQVLKDTRRRREYDKFGTTST